MAPVHDGDGGLPVQICWKGICKEHLLLCQVINAAVAQCRLPPNSDGTGLLLHIRASKQEGSCSLEGTSISQERPSIWQVADTEVTKVASLWDVADTEVSHKPQTVIVGAKQMVRTFSAEPIFKSCLGVLRLIVYVQRLLFNRK